MRADALRELVDLIADAPGVVRVAARPNTGSVIIEHLVEADTIVDQLVERGVVALASPEKSPPLEQVAQLGLAQLDVEIGKRTEGALNLHTVLAAALVAGAVVQAARGNWAGPATTMLLSALSLIERGRR